MRGKYIMHNPRTFREAIGTCHITGHHNTVAFGRWHGVRLAGQGGGDAAHGVAAKFPREKTPGRMTCF
ncbi:MAG TPA: hypothetical protein PKX13_08485 [Acidiphilium sp.]|nr:hypothetical protein [Acidiphilium sp.]